MSTTTVERPAGAIPLRLWRDHEAEARALPGMELDAAVAWSDPGGTARRLYDDGVRQVELPDRVDLSGTDGGTGAGAGDVERHLRAVALVRDLTSMGVAVDWRVRMPAGTDWQVLCHLYPPSEVTGPDLDDGRAMEDPVTVWRRGFYLCKCVYRMGPGFVQVRDRRAGELARFTIEEPDYAEVIEALVEPVPVGTVPESILADFLAENLVLRVGDLACWLPYRTRRWPTPSMVV